MESSDLGREFERLTGEADEQARGYAFESLIQGLFEDAGFQVRRNVRAARPRQTDLYAIRGSDHFLIEAKWRKVRRNVDDIDALRSRLGRVPGRVVGVIFSMSGYTKEAIDMVESQRDREVLLVDGSEITDLFQGRAGLRTLLDAKRDALVRDARVLVVSRKNRWEGFPRPDLLAVDAPSTHPWTPGEGRQPWIRSGGGFGRLLFVEELPDIDWRRAAGDGVSLDLYFDVHSRRDLDFVFDTLRRTVGLTSAGRFSIQQADTSWYGTGAVGLLSALDARSTRYQEVEADRERAGEFERDVWHHTEEASYFDVCPHGFFTLSLDVRARKPSDIRSALFSAQLAGIPLDPEPYRALVRQLGREEHAVFRPLGRPSVIYERSPHDGEDVVRLEVVSLLRAAGGTMIGGVVVRNPWFGTGRDTTLIGWDEARTHLDETELLVCRLASWHDVGDRVDYYFLRRVELALTTDVVIAEVVADWHDWIVRANPLAPADANEAVCFEAIEDSPPTRVRTNTERFGL
jgi:hypothetical protein